MKKYCFWVDLGGTTVKIWLFYETVNLLDNWEIPTRTEEEGKNILPDIAKSLSGKLEEKQISREAVTGVGLGAPGPIDKNGIVHKAVNLGWGVFSIKDILEELCGLPVRAGNDANVAALGEMWKGGGQGYRNLVLVTLGTGVGGGVIVNGETLSGSIGAGGEIGHIHIQDGEEDICGCGNHGCLEQYASATGIVRLAKRRLKATDEESVLRGSEVSAKAVFDAVKAGDEVAIQIAEEFGEYLGKGLAAVATVVNPEAFVIGGGVSKAGEILFSFVEKNYKKYVFHGSRDAVFRLATLGNDAGIYGAAKLILK